MPEVLQKVVVRSLLELDVLVAERVMSFEGCSNCGEKAGCGCEAVGIGSGLPAYSTSIADAWQVRDAVKTWLFSKRMAFKEHLLDAVSDRVISKNSRFRLTYTDLILHIEPVDFCLAALKTVGIEVTLELPDATN